MAKQKSIRKISIATPLITWIDIGDLSTSQAAPAATARASATVLALTATGIALWDIPIGYNCIEVRFSTKADGDDQVVDVLAASGTDEFVRVATLTLKGGTQTAPAGARATAGVYCDTMVISNKAWPGDMEVVEGGGNDYIARFVMDLLGYDKILFHATTLKASTIITVEGRGF